MIKFLKDRNSISIIGKEFDEFLEASGLKAKIDLDELKRKRIDKMIADSDIISMHKELKQLQKGIDHNKFMLVMYERDLERHSNIDDNSLLKYNYNEKIEKCSEKIKQLKADYRRVELAYNRLGGDSYYYKLTSTRHHA